MPRTEEANQRLREAQRAKILESASKVFARKGMATTMVDVTVEASVSQGLAYRYFANKEALFHALVEQAMQVSPVIMLEMPGTPGEHLTLLVKKMVEMRREQPEFFQLLDQVPGSETMLEDFHTLLRRRGQIFLDLLRQLIVEAQETSEVIAGDPDQLVTAIAACLEGLTRLALHNPEQIKKHCPDTEILLRMLKPQAGQE